MALNFGDILDAVAPHRGDSPALSSDDRHLTWSEFDSRTNQIARKLLSLGLNPGDKVCFLLFNGAEYVELVAACFKARLVHVNANYRYLTHEIEYILRDSDAAALVYDSELHDRVASIGETLRQNCVLIECGSDQPAVPGALSYSSLTQDVSSAPLDIKRSPDDMIFIYTGGTTGKPKGVMWRQGEQARGLLADMFGSDDEAWGVDDLVKLLDSPKPYLTPLIASPMMHAAGLYIVLTSFANGGHIVVTDNRKGFDAHHHWELVARHKVDAIGIVGDTFAKPLLAALDERAHDTSSVRLIGSSGVMWSTPVKIGLLQHIPQATMFDSLGSSEAMGLGASLMTADGAVETAKFKIGEGTKVFDESDCEVTPGGGRVGRLARSGPMPIGYYKDQAKTDATFQTIDGTRYSIPGDMCTVDADGTIHLLGRGSACINTGGEKVFPEEVEEALKLHPAVKDALCFGMPDDKWGQSVQAVINADDVDDVTNENIRAFLRDRLAPYKIPKSVLISSETLRMSNGKADYKHARELFSRRMAGSA